MMWRDPYWTDFWTDIILDVIWSERTGVITVVISGVPIIKLSWNLGSSVDIKTPIVK
jgi:hypothetical protein